VSPRSRITGGGSGPRRFIIGLVVIVALLVGIDFAARAVAEDVMATKLQQKGLTNKPDVSIGGFPFLTQVASKSFQKVSISDTGQVAGPVTISRLSATATGIKLNSFAFSSGTISSLNGTGLISFGSLGSALDAKIGPLGSVLNGAGLDFSAAGPDEVKASLLSVSAVWRVTRVSGSRVNLSLTSNPGGLASGLLDKVADVNLDIPTLPLGLTINSIQVTAAGVVATVSSQNVSFGS
jgi:hypothetical protein